MNPDQAFHALSAEETRKELGCPENGLSRSSVRKRREGFGRNPLEEFKKKSILSLLISQFNNPVIYLLTAAVLVSFLFSDVPEAIAIIIVILLNALIGFWMEYRAENSLDALKKMDSLRTRVFSN